jgi:hypothetical protein
VAQASEATPLNERRGCFSRSRNLASVLALIFGLWMFLWVVVLGWATETVFEREEFSKRTVQLLDSSAVRTQLSNTLADQIIESGPSTLVSYRSVLVIVVESVVQTDAFKEIFKQAVRAAHDAAFQDESADSIVLNLVDSLSVITGTLAVTAPDVAKQIPPNISELAVQITEQVRALQLGQVGSDLDDLIGQTFLVALVAIAVSIALATNRRHSAMRLGFGLVAVAALVLIAVQLGRHFGTNAIADPGLRAAVRSSVDVVTADLRSQMIWLGVFGILVAAVANASSTQKRRFELSGARSWFERRVVASPSTSWGRVARGLAFVLVGIMVLVNTQFVLQVAVALVGAWIAYIGFTEVMLVVGRRPGAEVGVEGAPGTAAQPASDGLRWWRVAALTAALVVVIGVGAVLSTRSARTTASAAGETECNGYAELCDKRVDEVVFATSHNSMSAAREPDWLFGEHFGGINAQLQYGIRGFLIDTHYGVPSRLAIPGSQGQLIITDAGSEVMRAQLTEPPSPEQAQRVDQLTREVPVGVTGVTPDIYLCHNYCELGATKFTDALAQYKQFLDHNPNEVIVLFLEDYVTTTDSEIAFRQSGLIDHVWTPQAGAPMPTLREMIDARRQVIVLSEHLSGPPDWYQAGFQVSEETPYEFKTTDEFSCAPNRGGTGKPLLLMNHWLTSGSPDVDAATRANSYDVLMGRIRACEAERGRMVNMVGINFYDRGDLLKVVNELNGVED